MPVDDELAARLLAEFGRDLGRLARFYRLRPEDAEDCLQEALLGLVRRADRVADPVAYVRRALQLQARTRRASKRPEVSLDERPEGLASEPLNLPEREPLDARRVRRSPDGDRRTEVGREK